MTIVLLISTKVISIWLSLSKYWRVLFKIDCCWCLRSIIFRLYFLKFWNWFRWIPKTQRHSSVIRGTWTEMWVGLPRIKLDKTRYIHNIPTSPHYTIFKYLPTSHAAQLFYLLTSVYIKEKIERMIQRTRGRTSQLYLERLGSSEFSSRANRAKFVIILPTAPTGTGVILRYLKT